MTDPNDPRRVPDPFNVRVLFQGSDTDTLVRARRFVAAFLTDDAHIYGRTATGLEYATWTPAYLPPDGQVVDLLVVGRASRIQLPTILAQLAALGDCILSVSIT